MSVSPEDVLAFWFEETRPERWFEQDDAFDEAIRARFAPAVALARDGALDSWAQTARGCLALVILIDQLSRHIHRGTPLAWSSDSKALGLTVRALEQGFDEQLRPAERPFLYMPLMHSEDLGDQARCVELFAVLAQSGSERSRRGLEAARRHHEIIGRFGRFPHRNAVLGRATTPEEDAFLKEPNSSF